MAIQNTRKTSSPSDLPTTPRRRPRRSEASRRTNRRLLLEPLERRELLTAAPELFAVRPNEGELFRLGEQNVLSVAPRELSFYFKGGADVDRATLDGIRITRAGADGQFDVASTRSDLGTGGQVVMEFRASNLGEEQEGIRLVFTESNHGVDGLPTVAVSGTTITVDLNRNDSPGNLVSPTTAGMLRAAINDNEAASALLRAEIVGGTAADPPEVDLTADILLPATLVSAELGIKFTARQSGSVGNAISVDVTAAGLPAGSGPLVSVAGNTISLTLNTTPGSETTVEELIQAIRDHGPADQLVVVEEADRSGFDATTGDPAAYSPLVTAGGSDIDATGVTHFGTAGLVRMQFTSLLPGVAGNVLRVVIVEASELDHQQPPGLELDGSDVRVTLNRSLGSQTTAEQLRDAINSHPQIGGLIRAEVISPPGTQYTGLTTAWLLSALPWIVPLAGGVDNGLTASVESDLGTAAAATLRFEAVAPGVAGNGIDVVFTEEDLGPSEPPDVQVVGTTVGIVLNTNSASPTTFQQLVDEINVAAAGLLTASLLGAAETPVTRSDPAGYSPLALAGGGDELAAITLTDANRAQVIHDFNAASPLGIRVSAQVRGEAGHGIRIFVESAALGAGQLPSVTVFGDTISVMLNNGGAGGYPATTAAQLVSALDALALVNATLLYGDPAEPIGERPINYSPLTLTGADDEIIQPGYRDLLNDNPNVVIVRFAQTLLDDDYRIELFAVDHATSTPPVSALRNTGGDAFQPVNPFADRQVVDFRLDLGAQIVSVVPQPVSRNIQTIDRNGATDFTLTFDYRTTSVTLGAASTAHDVRQALEGLPDGLIRPGDVIVTGSAGGPWQVAFHGRYNYGAVPQLGASDPGVTILSSFNVLSQAEDQVLVYFNQDRLDPAAAEDPTLYRLYDTRNTLDTSDDRLYLPIQVVYDEVANSATLIFDDDGDPTTAYFLPTAFYRLRVGQSNERNDDLDGALNIGTLHGNLSGFEHLAYLGDGDGTSRNAADIDLYKVHVVNGSMLNVTVRPLTATNPSLDLDVAIRLLDADGNEIAGTDVDAAGPGFQETITNHPVTYTGPIYVEVRSISGFGDYRINIGVTENLMSNSDMNSSFATATDLGVLGATEKRIENALIQAQTVAAPIWPGGGDEPGHRQIPSEWHIESVGVASFDNGSIGEIRYFFGSEYARDANNNALLNQINEAQKTRVREIFELVSHLSGIHIREMPGNPTDSGLLQIVVGDVCAIATCNTPEWAAITPPAIFGQTNRGRTLGQSAAIMNVNAEYGTSPYGGEFFTTTLHEIIHRWISHSSDVPSTMTGNSSNSPPADGVHPGLNDVVHLQRVNRPDSTDIDLYRVQLDEPGRLTAEIVAERRSTTSQLNSVLTLFDADGNVVAQNDDYFSNDSYLDVSWRQEPTLSASPARATSTTTRPCRIVVLAEPRWASTICTSTCWLNLACSWSTWTPAAGPSSTEMRTASRAGCSISGSAPRR
jgi:hypothetical protein